MTKAYGLFQNQFEENCFKVFIVSTKKTASKVNEIIKLQAFLQSLNDRKDLELNYISSAYGILALMVGARSGNPQQKRELHKKLSARRGRNINYMNKKMDGVYDDFANSLTEGRFHQHSIVLSLIWRQKQQTGSRLFSQG
uniref:LAGLIDADG homing endonuclease n=1 Tax=Knipowitschia caucasica TaxID=637954 RepID=A0AAV2JY80_KNICA